MEKQNRAMLEFLTASLLKDPQPKRAETISSEAISKAKVAGKLKNKLNSKDLFCNLVNLNLFLFLTYLLKLGKIIVPIAIPATAKFI